MNLKCVYKIFMIVPIIFVATGLAKDKSHDFYPYEVYLSGGQENTEKNLWKTNNVSDVRCVETHYPDIPRINNCMPSPWEFAQYQETVHQQTTIAIDRLHEFLSVARNPGSTKELFLIAYTSISANPYLAKQFHDVQHYALKIVFKSNGDFRGDITHTDIEKISAKIAHFKNEVSICEKDKGVWFIPQEVEIPDSKFLKKIKNNQFNKDICKVIELGTSGNWDAARTIVAEYKQKALDEKGWLTSGEKRNRYDLIDKIYDDCFSASKQYNLNVMPQKAAEQANQAPLQKPVETVVYESQEQLSIEDVQQSISIVEQCEHLDDTLSNLRSDVVTTLNQYSPEQLDALPKTPQEYALSSESKKLLQERNLDSKAFDVCIGNEVQRKVHREFATIVNIASGLYYKENSTPTVQKLACYAVEFAHAGNSYNQQGNIKQALAVADCSWSLLNCGKAVAKGCLDVGLGVGEGVIQAGTNIVHSVAHPQETAEQIGKAVEVAGYCLGKMIYEIATADEDLPFTHPEYYDKLCAERTQQLEAFIAFLDHAAATLKESSLRDISRETTAFLVEGYVTGKALGTAGKFLKTAKSTAVEIVQKAVQAAPEVVAITAEGIPVQMSIAEKAKNTFYNLMEKTGEKTKGFVHALPEQSRLLIAELNKFSQIVNQEIPQLKELFDETRKGFGEFATKFIKIPYEHILSIEYYAEGLKFSWSGFHHDFMGAIEKSGLAKFTNKIMGKNGCYKADVIINGIKKETTFFPQDWTRKEVIGKVFEAYDDFIAKGATNFKMEVGGKYEILGHTKENIMIKIYVTKSGRITSAYPIL